MNEAVAIPGFDPFMATNDGCIFNGETGKKLTTQLDKKGYEKITFRLHGQKKNMFVHRLVALAFIPNPDCKTQINHINGVKTDNSAANLEWCTPSENIKHAYQQGLLHQDGIPITGTTNWAANLGMRVVEEVKRLNGKTVSEGLLRRISDLFPADMGDDGSGRAGWFPHVRETVAELRALLSEKEGGKP